MPPGLSVWCFIYRHWSHIRNKTENIKQISNNSWNKASKWNDSIIKQWTHFPQNWLVKIQTASNSSSTHIHKTRDWETERERDAWIKFKSHSFIRRKHSTRWQDAALNYTHRVRARCTIETMTHSCALEHISLSCRAFTCTAKRFTIRM